MLFCVPVMSLDASGSVSCGACASVVDAGHKKQGDSVGGSSNVRKQGFTLGACSIGNKVC